MKNNYTQKSLEELGAWFKRFAEVECKGSSPLYERLCNQISQEQALIRLASHSRIGQPVPNLFLAAVHFLLLQNPQEELATYYPSISPKAKGEIPILLFRKFCEENRDSILDILAKRIVQTNAVNRTAYLMPILSEAFDKPIHLVDIGASSGLNLYLDAYSYDYGDAGTFGDGKMKIQSIIQEGEMPAFSKMIQIKRRIGIDQNPLDLTDQDTANWLKALIWPDMLDRFQRFSAALEIAKKDPITLIKASSIDDFESILRSIPISEPLAIYHTHVLYQFSPEDRKAFRAMLNRLGTTRDFLYLAVEGGSVFDKGLPSGKFLVEKNEFKAGIQKSSFIAEVEGHGRWIKWLNP